MDDIDRHAVCKKCKKRRPDEKETAQILLARRAVGQETLEKYARDQGYDFCVCLGFQFDKPESIRDLSESKKGLSYQDRQGFHVVKRSVGPDTRIDRAPWYTDDLATHLVLYSQYPPEQFERMYELVCKHWRGLEPMGEKVRKDMERLREKGEEVFGRGAHPVFDESQRSFLSALKRKGHILSYDSWKHLRKNSRRRRYKMNRSSQNLESTSRRLEVLIETFERSPNDFPFMSTLAEFETPRRFLSRLGTALRPLHKLRWLFSFPYLSYRCRAGFNLRRKEIHQFWKRQGKSNRFADLSTAAVFVVMLLSTWPITRWFYRVFLGWFDRINSWPWPLQLLIALAATVIAPALLLLLFSYLLTP